ncbi:MAG: anthranilate synthase component II [Candidatus Tyrphobacter sp.]
MKLLYIDHYDSFAYNVVHLLAAQGATPVVVKSDDPRLEPALLGRYAGVVIGPGPGHPREIPRVLEIAKCALERERPLLGVCLGLQVLGAAMGAEVTHAPAIMHGKTSRIEHNGEGIFKNVPSPLVATRYHSLALDGATLPASLVVTARSEDGVIQGVAVEKARAYAVQFHPESVLSEHGARIVRNFLERL